MLIEKKQFIPKDTQQIHPKFLANFVREDLSRFIKPEVFIRFVPNCLQVFAFDENEGIWCFTYNV